jgi:hypothetical protein
MGNEAEPQTYEVLNYSPHRWTPLLVKLPAYSAPITLDVDLQPRTSINFDTTLLSFVGTVRAP